MTPRHELLKIMSDRISEQPHDQVLRVAVDGVDGAGKTTFAEELAQILRERGRTVMRASVDSFHHPKSVRYRFGRDSPDGFFLDSYDYLGLKAALLDPLSPGGSGRCRTAIFDHETDSPVSTAEVQALPGAILILDGIFLHRPELRTYWDFSIFLEVAFHVSIPRGARRGPGFGSANPDAPENHRYVAGQQRYLRECTPKRYATVTIDNNDLAAPQIIAGDEIA